MKSAADFALWFLAKNHEDAEGCEDNYLTPMQLQKLLYFAQGYHLGCYGKPLFADAIKAWKYGPVIPVVYNKYANFKSSVINVPCERNDADFTPEELRTLQIVYKQYSKYSGIELSKMTHEQGSPWSNTSPNEIIDLHDIYNYFEDYMLSSTEEAELITLSQKAETLPEQIYSQEMFQDNV